MIVRLLALLLILCSIIFGQASIVHNGNNNILQNGLLLEYRLREGSGQQAFNNVGTKTPSLNLLNFSEGHFTTSFGWNTIGPATFTEVFAANPLDSAVTATRVVTASGDSYVYS